MCIPLLSRGGITPYCINGGMKAIWENREKKYLLVPLQRVQPLQQMWHLIKDDEEKKVVVLKLKVGNLKGSL